MMGLRVFKVFCFLFVSLYFCVKLPERAFADLRQETRFFGTLGVGSTDASYPYSSINNGANIQNLSRFGLNYSVTDERDLSFFAELVAQPKSLEATWYFINWRPTNAFMARIGRMRFASWIFSETRAIGYNYPWPTLPMDVYQFNPFDGITGVSTEYTFDLPFGNLSFEGQIGSVDGRYLGIQLNSEIAYVGSITYSTNNVTIFVSGQTANAKVSNSLIEIKKLETGYITAGLKASLGNVVLISEGVVIKGDISKSEKDQAQRDAATAAAQIQEDPSKAADPAVRLSFAKAYLANGQFIDSKAAYMHLGYEFDQIQPYILLAAVQAGANTSGSGSQVRYGCGFIWHATEQVALKIQGNYIDLDEQNTGLLDIPQQERFAGVSSFKKIEPSILALGSVDFLF